MTRPEGAANNDNMDDYNIVNSIELDTGTVQSAPVLPKDICNKEYVDNGRIYELPLFDKLLPTFDSNNNPSSAIWELDGLTVASAVFTYTNDLIRTVVLTKGSEVNTIELTYDGIDIDIITKDGVIVYDATFA